MLSVDTTPSGDAAGMVRSDPYLIDCPGACTRPYAPGTKVTLTEAPTRGFTFTAWSGATCDEGQTTSTCTFVITQDTHVVADYSGKYDPSTPDAKCCTLTVSVSGGFWGFSWVGTQGPTLNCYSAVLQAQGAPGYCSGTFDPGTQLNLFTGAWGTPFLGWSDGNTNTSRTVTITSNMSLSANWG